MSGILKYLVLQTQTYENYFRCIKFCTHLQMFWGLISVIGEAQLVAKYLN